MIIDLADLISNRKNKIDISSWIEFSDEYLQNTTIRRVNKIHFSGCISKLVDDSLVLEGILEGTLILPDDITLEDFEYTFSSEIRENLEENIINSQKNIDIMPILWQNILVEIPLRVVNPKNENVKLQGDGWRLIKEEDVKIENNPLNDLEELRRKE